MIVGRRCNTDLRRNGVATPSRDTFGLLVLHLVEPTRATGAAVRPQRTADVGASQVAGLACHARFENRSSSLPDFANVQHTSPWVSPSTFTQNRPEADIAARLVVISRPCRRCVERCSSSHFSIFTTFGAQARTIASAMPVRSTTMFALVFVAVMAAGGTVPLSESPVGSITSPPGIAWLARNSLSLMASSTRGSPG